MNDQKQTIWRALQDESIEFETSIRQLFETNPNRFDQFHLTFEDILFDFSKNLITDKTLDRLIQLAESCNLQHWIDQLFKGEKINFTEDRAVLHVALRRPLDQPLLVDGVDVMPEVHLVLDR
eukprot:TRINITY_DN1346_c0_g1_i1.p1 TRINITY_DN1346_c0_g1~~TRINITY_DN1346_c0_g1_i1.p1  ORF type:complete len:131 (-),score=27.73 TRINITY_DN1346_c0_g1_i1:446-811(-)